MYQPWHTRRSLPPSNPSLATSNISPNNIVNTDYIGQCSKEVLYAGSGRQTRRINELHHTMTSSSKIRQETLGSRPSPSHWAIAELAIQTEACSGETKGNAHSKQRREREMDRGLCWELNCCGMSVSWRQRDSDWAGVGRNEKCWKHGINNKRAWKNVWGDDDCYRRQSGVSSKFRWWGGWGWWAW